MSANYVPQLSVFEEKPLRAYRIERAQKAFTHSTHFLIRRVIFIVVIIVIWKQMELVKYSDHTRLLTDMCSSRKIPIQKYPYGHTSVCPTKHNIIKNTAKCNNRNYLFYFVYNLHSCEIKHKICGL